MESDPNFLETGSEAARDSGKRRLKIDSRLKRGTIATALALILIAFVASAPAEFPRGGGIVTIAPGENLKNIGTQLKDEHFIRSRVAFSTLISIFGDERHIASGDFYFAKPIAV